ncbi:MAG: preprotein translocase subunit YajC [Bdellovibrionaceae bacterium]|jgi:preprotein translocase subunit YajC|nr:preprotein translocase subunit YajC [Pseudobdellovibrionaceae bacterium]
MFSSVAYAQAAGAAAATPSMLEQFLPIIAIFVIFYFLMIRPQSKKMKQQATFLTQLKRGDQVLTTGGILGSIEGLTDEYVTLEVAQGVRIRILKNQIASSQNSEEKK